MRWSFGAALTMVAGLSTVAAAESVTIVPRPASSEPRSGAFVLSTGSVIVTEPDVTALDVCYFGSPVAGCP